MQIGNRYVLADVSDLLGATEKSNLYGQFCVCIQRPYKVALVIIHAQLYSFGLSNG